MEDQTLSIEQMQELTELGIDTSKASLCWLTSPKFPTWTPKLKFYTKDLKEGDHVIGLVPIPTFTLQDILEIIRKQTFTEGGLTLTEGYENTWICCFTFQTAYEGDYTNYEQFGDTSLEAAFNMLKWVKQNNYI